MFDEVSKVECPYPPIEDWSDPVWRMYQDRIEGMPELGDHAVCIAVFEHEDPE